MAAVLVALADAAHQEVAVHVGWQDHFSLAAALTAGIEAGVTAGVMGVQAGSLSELTKSITEKELTDLIMKSGEIAVANQLTEMSMGLRDKFDFGAVMADVMSAVAIYKAAPLENNLFASKTSAMRDVVHSEVQGFIGGGLHAAVSGQKLNVEMIAASSLGSAVGRNIGESIGAMNQAKPASKTYQKAQKSSVNANDNEMPDIKLDDPKLDFSDASYQLSEINRAKMGRAERWNANSQKTTANKYRSLTASEILIEKAQQSGNGEPYSFIENASPLEKVVLLGGGTVALIAVLPEATLTAVGSVSTTLMLGGHMTEFMMVDTLGAQVMGGAGIMAGEGVLASKFGLFGGAERSVGAESATFAPKIGDKVYRVWGDEAGSYGRSWTRTDPGSIPNYRNIAGLPDQNTGRFVSEGYLKSTADVTHRAAIPLHGNAGGLDEILVPNPREQIQLTGVSGVNRPF